MKKFALLFVTVFAAFALFGCASNQPLASTEKAYYIMGAFDGWAVTNGDTTYEMAPIAVSDSTVSSIADQLKGATQLYVIRHTFTVGAGAGWTITYTINGTETTVDGYLAIKIIRTAIADADTVDYWMQSPESGAITNLTPDTLYIPPYTDPSTADTSLTGGWNDNPIALAEGSYYIVFAVLANGNQAMGLVPVF